LITTALILTALISVINSVDEGIDLYLIGEMEACVSSLENFIAAEDLSLDDLLRAYHRLGTAYYGLGETNETRESFKKVLRLDPYFDLGPWENPALQEILDEIRDTEMTSIMIEGSPEYSMVFYDDKYIGSTPLQKDNLFIGDTYSFIVLAEGYNPKEIVITIQPETLQTVSFSLTQRSLLEIDVAMENPTEGDGPPVQEDIQEEDIQVAQDIQAPNDMPVQDDIQVAQNIQPADEVPVQEDIQVVQDIQPADEVSVQDDIQVSQDIQPVDEVPVQDDIQVTQDIQPVDEVSVQDDIQVTQDIQAPVDMPVQEDVQVTDESPERSEISESMALLLGDNVTMTSLENVSLQLPSSEGTQVQSTQTDRDYNQFRGTVTPIEIEANTQNAMTFSEITFESHTNTAAGDAVFSSRTSEEIMQVLSSKVSTVTFIYNKHIRNDPLLSGTLLIEITVETSGRVSEVNVLESSTYNPAFDLELAGAIEGWRFGVVDEDEDPLVIQYPFTFSR